MGKPFCYIWYTAATTALWAALVTVGSAQSTPRSAAHDRARVNASTDTIVDVRLNPAGQFLGHVVDPAGRPIARTRIAIASRQGSLEISTDERGAFVSPPLAGGVYVMRAGRSQQAVRLWTADVAPPQAVEQLMFVQGDVVRGQYPPPYPGPFRMAPYPGVYDGALRRTLTNPWLLSGGLAAGVAVPLALDKDDAS